MRIVVIIVFFVSLVTASAQAVDVLEFRKVDYFEVVSKANGEFEEKKRDARFEIDRDTQQLRIVDEKNGAFESDLCRGFFCGRDQHSVRASEISSDKDRHLSVSLSTLFTRQGSTG